MKRVVIGIPYSTHNLPANFKALKRCCEVLTNSMLNGYTLDIKEHASQLREGGCELGRGGRVDREDG